MTQKQRLERQKAMTEAMERILKEQEARPRLMPGKVEKDVTSSRLSRVFEQLKESEDRAVAAH